MTLEDIRIRFNIYRKQVQSKNRISEANIQVVYKNEKGDFLPIKAVDHATLNGKEIFILS